MPQHFIDEILGQPSALGDLLWQYEGLEPQPFNGEKGGVLLTGMGASYHAASIAVYQLQRKNIFAQAVEAIDLLNYPSMAAQQARTVVYISQSGASGEVVPVFSGLGEDIGKIGITNHADSPLATHADVTLLLHAGDELTVATKTYVNSLALLALLSGIDVKALHDIRTRISQLLDSAEQIRSLWLDTLSKMETLYFLGHGPHAITAKHCAMMAAEWSKRAALSASIGAFRHGFIEAVGAGTGVVIFAPSGVGQQSAHDLARELTSYGATVLLVENGQTRRLEDKPAVKALDDELLSPMVDVIPVQIFVEALARESGYNGFRYISKVVSQI
jgi:glutamine---fructose-6-phosphate transaminase (isomerizing)